MRGEVGLHRRCNPGEGVQVYRWTLRMEGAPHPNPLPVRTGRGSRGADAAANASYTIFQYLLMPDGQSLRARTSLACRSKVTETRGAQPQAQS
ncbi:hypothetical protein WN72_39070 [Bradyrhizobium arachidis]|uniref:Uncharacterized protein n=1 Tax=Bradyrhizobium arachidis TaxID=858423 RepID=A0AAE7TK20_9BRAD|nr:hypothetical protein WN72_39070 [Bradyrhizobium arachidis]